MGLESVSASDDVIGDLNVYVSVAVMKRLVVKLQRIKYTIVKVSMRCEILSVIYGPPS